MKKQAAFANADHEHNTLYTQNANILSVPAR